MRTAAAAGAPVHGIGLGVGEDCLDGVGGVRGVLCDHCQAVVGAVGGAGVVRVGVVGGSELVMK